jgi:endonuclease/exonuclease/phosphatase family metal-dependent hydrolase
MLKRIGFKFIPGFLFLFFLLISCKIQQISEEKTDKTVRILSYNVRNCRGMDDVTDYRRVAGIISHYTPDVAAIQELDSATQRSKGVVVLDTLASLTGMYRTYSASIAYQGGKYGVGILSKEKPVSHKVIPLPGNEEKRSLLIVEFKEYCFCCTHFSLTQADRIVSAEIVNQAVNNFTKPVFIAGDFNATQNSSEIARLVGKWVMLNNPALLTSPADNPGKCIDYIFGAINKKYSFHVNQTSVGNEPVASDHRPVFAEVKIGQD